MDSKEVTSDVYTVSSDLSHASKSISHPSGTGSLSINDKKISQDDLNLTIKLYKSYKICIYKPLIPLKLAQFCWFGAASFMGGFITVFLKQRGVSLSELSWMNVIAPIVQLIGTTITGIIADKLGRSKPVLVTNLLIVMAMVIGMLLMPSMKSVHCKTQNINLVCLDHKYYQQITKINCDFTSDVINVSDCNAQCLKNVTQVHNQQEGRDITRSMSDFPIFIEVNATFKLNNSCYYDIASSESISNTLCEEYVSKQCQITCTVESKSKCHIKKVSMDVFLIGYVILYIFYVTTFSNVYRCLDVTAMALTKEHNGDFGRERFFAICGNLMISPLAGYIADATTVKGEETNYAATFYLFIVMVCLVLIILYKLPVCVNPPGNKMWKKSFHLLKNPDIVSLAFVILVLGTAWNFTKVFAVWYLAELHAPSLLIGLIPSISALYGLPFLLTSSWWIKRIGCTHIFLLAFICYIFFSIGMSFLVNPWYSLLLEGFGAITYYLLWVAVVLHSHKLAPEGMRATVVAVAGAIHYSIGKSSSGLVGGLVMNSFGGRAAFRLIAIICLLSALLYGLYLHIRIICVSKELELHNLNEASKHEEESKCIYVLINPT